MQAGNKGGFLSLDFGLKEFGVKSAKTRLEHYRRFLYLKGGLGSLIETGEKPTSDISNLDRFLYRTRYFTDSGIIGTKAFVENQYLLFQHHFSCKKKKIPKSIQGLQGIYSLKRFAETL